MLFDRPERGETAILVHVNFGNRSLDEDLLEFEQLALSAGASPADIIVANRHDPDAKFFVGKGKSEEIRAAVQLHKADLVLFNHPLTPAQERNLERLFECRVLDRIGLILDIFALRARTFEGKLQVELAQLQHMSTRLVRGWTHLERQKGGIGLRGPGETQLETDRRLIRSRMKTIHKRLDKVRAQRGQMRRSRERIPVPTVSIVGYTNAGKSSLFNQLTTAETYVADQLFATLDPTLRRLDIPGYGYVVLADTVGFIRDLPHDLVDAFYATLEETREADLLIHVIDVHNEARDEHITEVEAVLKQIEADKVPQIRVFNKIDLLPDCSSHVEYDEQHQTTTVWLSALKQDGLSLLKQAIADRLRAEFVTQVLTIPPRMAALRASLYQRGVVQTETIDELGNCLITVCLPAWEVAQLKEQLN
ncbi:MAG: ribosome rescue GTPase HflX [Gammaproteobacteria bacterium]